MRAFDENPQLRWLFVFAHPDDELGVCAWMRRLVGAGATVRACWIHHTPVRKAEAVRSMLAIGVAEEALWFLPGDDGRIAEQMPELWPLLRRTVSEAKPDRVVTIAFEQGHLDHDATNMLVNRSFDGPVFEYPMYHPYTRRIQILNRFATPEGQEILELTEEECELKKRLARAYPSQNIHSVLVWYHVYRWLTLRPVHLCRSERLRRQTHRDYCTPNLPARFRREVERSEEWRRWLAAATRFLSLEHPGW